MYKLKRIKELLACAVLLAAMQGCSNQKVIESTSENEIVQEAEENKEEIMKVTIDTKEFEVELEDNEAVEELMKLLREAPIAIEMQDYAGFEKVGSLGRSLTTSNHQTTTKSGDIVLYNGNQIVIFYGSNSWSYTRLGHIKDLSGWKEALGNGDVTVTFSVN